jgi:hypothetical protein
MTAMRNPMVDGHGDEFMSERLRVDFHGWKVWQTDSPSMGRPHYWFANRNHVLTGAEMVAGLHHTVAAKTALELREKLRHQAELERQIDEARRRAAERDKTPDFGPAYL